MWALFALTPAQEASAGPGDNFSLAMSDNVGGRALIGEEVTFTITASGDHASGNYLYNVSFAQTLPPGVELVSSDAPPTATLVDVPAPGQTTLIWSNVSDLPANSVAALNFTVDTNPDFAGGASGSGTVPVTAILTLSPNAVASLDPFLIPDFSEATGAFTAEFDGTAATSHSVEIIPFRVDKFAEGELLRGVHANGIDGGGAATSSLYTIEIENNPDYTTNGVTLRDTLHPMLEFLGCTDYYAADNSATVLEEWTGSGPVESAPCPGPVFTPTSVDTGAGGETIVDWTIGTLAPGQIATITYHAGVPLYANAPFSAPPAPTGLTQGRNLDNNTGASTGEADSSPGTDPELLSSPEALLDNTAAATGTYSPSGATSTETDTFMAEAEDLKLSKSMSGSLNHGGIVTTTLTIETGEYRDFSNLVVRDLLPSGLCFLGTFNSDLSGSDWNTTDCAGAGSSPARINGVPTDVARVRELPDGGDYGTGRMELVWDFADPDNAVLAGLDSDSTITIEFDSVVRQYFRGGLASLPGEPVLAGDTVTNVAEVSGPDIVAGAGLPADTADPDGGVDGDTADASITNEVANINKRVSVKTGPLANNAGTTGSTCFDDYATITWSEAEPNPELGYGPGDIVCFELNASFPGNVNYEGATIQELMPPGYNYIAGSAQRIAAGDTLPTTTFTETPEAVTFTVGGSGDVGNNGNSFQWVVAADITNNALGEALDINANLEKLVHNNNGGLVFQLRDQTDAEWTEPQVRVATGVDSVNGSPSAGPDSDGSLTSGSTATEVTGSDVVTYRVDVWNTGNTDALNTIIQDVIPPEFTCADISNISNGGTCAGGVITWPAATVPLSTGGADTTPDDETTAPITYTYDLTVPDTVDPSHTYSNTAGAATYQGVTNTGPYDYYPDDNVDPANASLENTDAGSDPAYIVIRTPDLTMVQQSGIAQTGNVANPTPATTDDQLTIGEIIEYQITATVPQGTTLYDATITSDLPPGISWFTGMGYFDGVVSDLQPTTTSPTGSAGIITGTIAEAAGTVTYPIPAPYTNAGSSGDDQVTITFYGIVDDIVANSAATPTAFPITSELNWNDAAATAATPVSTSPITSEVVEPNLTIDKSHTVPVGTEVQSGDPITYEITLSNPSTPGNVSVAHDLLIVDAVPPGITPIGGSGPVSTDGDLVPSISITPAGSFDGIWSETNHTITWTPDDIFDPDEVLHFSYDAEVDDPAVSSGVLVNVADATVYSLDQNVFPISDPNIALGRTYTVSDDDTLTLPLASLTKDIEPFDAGDPTNDKVTFAVGEPVDYQLSVFIPNGTVLYDGTLFDTLPAGLEFDTFGTIVPQATCVMWDAVGAVSTGLSITPADIEQFNPAGGNAAVAAWYVGDLYAAGDCEITFEYTTHVTDSTVDTDVVNNDALFTWNATSVVADESPTALTAGYDTPTSPSWTNASDPGTEALTVVEPLVEIDQDVTAASGTALGSPACDTTPGNNNGSSDDPDGALADGCDVAPGSAVTYTLTVTSVGTTDAHDITVVETVPVGITPLDLAGGSPVTTTGATVTGASGSVGTWDETARTITWSIPGPLAPAAAQTLDYDAVIDASDSLTRGQDLTTTADVSTYFALPSVDRAQIVLDNPANDDLITYGNDAAATRGALTPDVNTIEVHFPELSIVTVPATGQDITDVLLDQPFTWEITVTNVDPIASAYNVDVVDVLPEGWTFDPGSATTTTPFGSTTADPVCTADTGSCADAAALNVETLTWTDLVSGPTEPLGPGETITISFTAIPQAAALTSTQAIGEAHTGYDAGTGPVHTNQASTTGEDASGSDSCCDPDGAGVAPPEAYAATDSSDVWIARSDIEVNKTITPIETDSDPSNGPYWFGAWAYYTVTVTNVGPDAATGVDVAEILDPTGLEFDSVDSIDAGSFDDTTNVWTVGNMANTDSFELVLRTRLVEVGPVTNIAQNAAADQYDSDSTPNNSVAAEDDQASVTIEVVPTTLGDFVWLDLNADGVQDPGEQGIPGVVLDLTWLDPATGASQSTSVTTAADGSYGVPTSANIPSFTDITVTVDPASANLLGLTPSFDRDGTFDGSATDQVTPADTVLPDGSFADLAFDFGYTPDGAQSLGDTIWWDQDNSADSTNGGGEIPLENIGVTATWAGWDDTFGTADDVDFTRTTGALGDYLFNDIPPGLYEVAVTVGDLPPGLDTPTFDLDGTATPALAALTIDPAEAQLDVDFSFRGVGLLGDTVWFDHDASGTVDTGEPGLGGVDLVASWSGPDGLTGTTDDIAFPITTTSDGPYLFDNMPYGDYVITVNPGTLPGGMVPTFDQDGTATPDVSIATLAAGSVSDQNQDFGYRGAGTIGDTVFFDVDGTETDGLLDSGDAPVVGATVTVVWNGADGAPATGDEFSYDATTIAGGLYSVTDLPHGNYTVTVDPTTLPAGLMTPTFDFDGVATANTSSARLTPTAPDSLDQDFAYTGSGVGQIGDVVYFDQDNDGVQDPTEVGFTSVTLNLTWFGPDGVLGGTDDVVQTTTTGVDGAYLFDNLPDGNYLVAVDDTTIPAGLAPSVDDDGVATPNESLVSISPTAVSNFDQDFGYAGVGSIGDTVWFDVDNSGTALVDAGEIGIPNVDLTIVWTNPQGDDVTFDVTTDSDGAYLVPFLPYGAYDVSLDPTTLPGGLVQTFDVDGLASPDASTVTLDATIPDNTDQDFSYTGVGSLGDTLWFDQNADGALDPVGSGVFDDQDQPLANIDVLVTWAGFDDVVGNADDLTYVATTDANGEWSVADLAHGDYAVTVDTTTLPPGINVPSHDADGMATPDTSAITLDDTLTDDATQDFSYTGAGQVGSIVWFDLDGDAVIDPLEVPLAGVAINLEYVGPNGTLVTASTVTGPDGTYQFINLPFDTPITITVDDTTLPAGFVPVWDADDAVATPHTSVATLADVTPVDPGQN
ncbi:MAG: SdrD B-like domain-containing protein, partial [Acidimicrobiales bacterium]